ncbi:MAG: hypothetical protein A2V67_09835 [Deltaproteobacteria bacterium RBG_13_61_14]|nr:MAG: hypothetical protein A2V67_09835 [Deltaproteobacteria bacterium RBG_13_61_14]
MAVNNHGPSLPELPRIQLKYANLDAFAKAARKTFKLGRMTLKSKKELNEGNRVGLSVSVPERDQPIEIIGEIIDVVRGSEGPAFTYGVRFLNFSEKKLTRLLELGKIASEAGVAPTPPPPPAPSKTPEPEQQAPAEPPPNEVPVAESSSAEEPSPEPAAAPPSDEAASPPSAREAAKAAAPERLAEEETEVYTIEVDHGRKPATFDGREETQPKIPIEVEPFPTSPSDLSEDSGTIELPATEAEPPSQGPISTSPSEEALTPSPASEAARDALEDLTPEPAPADEEMELPPEEMELPPPVGETEEITLPEGPRELKPMTPAEYEALGAFLLRLTRQLLPAGKAVPAKTLWEEFRTLMEGRDELSLFLNSLPTGKDFLLEGTGPAPASLKTVIPRELTADLVTKLAELFERKKILGLTIRRYLSEEAFEQALRRFGAYLPEMSRPEELVAGLLEAKAFDFTPIFAADRPAGAESLPWRTALFLARMAGDLRRLPLFAQALSEEPRAVLTLRMEESLKPLREPALLAEILVHCDLAAQGQEEFSGADLQSEIVFALPLEVLVQTVERVAVQFEQAFAAKQAAAAGPDLISREEALRKTLRRAVARVAYESAESGMKILSRLYRKGVLSYEELPEALRDRVDAERSADEFMADLTARLAQFEAVAEGNEYRRQSRKLVNILIEFVRRDRMDLAEQIFKVTVGHRTDKTPPFPERPGLAREAMGVFGEAASLEILVKAFQSDQKEVRERVASLLYAAGEPAVPVLLDVLAESSDRSVRKLACDVLIRLGEKVAPKVKDRIFRSDTPWFLARNLIMVLGDLKCQDLVSELDQFLGHDHPRVREETLSYLMKVEGVDPEPRLVRSLQDPDPMVRRRAIQHLGHLPQLAEAAIQGVVWLVEKKGESEPNKEDELVFLQALDLLARKKPAKVPDGRSLQSVLVGLWELESKGLFKRLSGAKSLYTPRMRAAMVEAMGRVGGEKCRKALAQAGKDKDEMVRKAAKAAVERKPE